jgi:hypothetical protein
MQQSGFEARTMEDAMHTPGNAGSRSRREAVAASSSLHAARLMHTN